MAEKNIEQSREVQEHPSITAAIRTAMARGYDKETIQRVTGASYEVVDREFQRAKGKKPKVQEHRED